MFNTMANQVMVNPRGLGEDSTVFLAGNDANGTADRGGPGGRPGLD